MLNAIMAILLAAGQSAPAPVFDPRYGPPHALRGDALFKATMLAEHNRARVAAGVPLLTWDETLADHALAYARTLAAEHRFEHARQTSGPGREGENLWMGSRGRFDYRFMIGGMIDEGRFFVNRPTPNFSTTGRWADVDHYTQIIWSGTTHVGCAIASNETDDYLVCRYSPPGNVMGRTAF